MKLFGSRSRKIDYNYRQGVPLEIQQSLQEWTFVHNFRVHYKTSRFNLVASKMDIGISTTNPIVETSDNQKVIQEFYARFGGFVNNPLAKRNVGFNRMPVGTNITDIEYLKTTAIQAK